MSEYEFWNELGNIYGAIVAYQQKAVEFNNRFITPWIRLGNVFEKQRLSEDAIKAYQKAIEIDPKNAHIWNELGNIYFNAGAYAEAIDTYNKAIDLDPEFGWPYSNLALVYTYQGRYAEAIPLYQRSTELLGNDRDKAVSWNRLGNAYRRLGDYSNAVAAFEIADKLDPGSNAFREDLSEIHNDLSQLDGAADQAAVIDDDAIASSGMTDEPIPQSDICRDDQREVQIEVDDHGDNVVGDGGATDENAVAESGMVDEFGSDSLVLSDDLDEMQNGHVETGDRAEAGGGEAENAGISVSGASDRYDLENIDVGSDLYDLHNDLGQIDSVADQTVSDKNTGIAPEITTENYPVNNKVLNGNDEGHTELDPKNAHVWNELGNIYFNTGAYDEAINAYNKAINLAPQLGWPYNNMALAYTCKGKYAKAIPLYLKSIELLSSDREKAISWNSLGNAYQRQNDYNNAIVACQKAIELDPDNAAFKDDLSEINKNLGQLDNPADQAGIEDDTLVAPGMTNWLTPDNFADSDVPGDIQNVRQDLENNVVNEGETTKGNGIPEPAMSDEINPDNDSFGDDHGNVHAQVDPKSAYIWNELGNIYFNIGAYDEAVDAYNKATELSPGFGWPYSNLALMYTHQDRYSEAIPLYQRGIELLSSDREKAISWNRLGKAYQRLNDYNHAIVAYQKAVELDPDNTAFRNDLNEIQTELRDHDNTTADRKLAEDNIVTASGMTDGLTPDNLEFIDALEKIQDEVSTPDDNSVDDSVVSNNSLVVSSGMADEIVTDDFGFGDDPGGMQDALVDLIKIRTTDGAVTEGNAVSQTGIPDDLDQVDASYGESVDKAHAEIDPKNAYVWDELGNIYFSTGAHDEAIDAYNKAIELTPEFGWPYSNLALVYMHQGRYAEAVPLYQRSIELFSSDKDKAISWNRLGNAYRRLNDYENAIAAYQRADEIDPDNTALPSRARFSLLSNFYVKGQSHLVS